VQFKDGSIKAQLGLPDMKLPIQYALTYPERLPTEFPRFDFAQHPQLTFEKPDFGTFTNLKLSFQALEKGGNLPCALNAANEVAVQAFLEDKISFLQIAEINGLTMERVSFVANPDLTSLVETNSMARRYAEEAISF